MKFVLAPDSFKGSLNQLEVANAIGDFIGKNNHDVIIKPMSDGGDGLLYCFTGLGYTKKYVTVNGPEGDKVEALYLMKGKTAIIETAQACGLDLITDSPPEARTTFGVGELVLDAVKNGAREIILGLGGSATSDGGYGMLLALGADAYDGNNNLLDKVNSEIPKIHHMDVSKLIDLSDIDIKVASDVTNPLLGENGAVYTFGSQKGLVKNVLPVFEAWLAHLQPVISDVFENDYKDEPGSGAAGGLGWMLASIGAEIISGGPLIADLIGVEEDIKDADYVITGEGRSDGQTLHGKVPSVVSDIAVKHDIPCILLSGSITEDFPRFHNVYSLLEYSDTVEAAMNDPQKHIELALTDMLKDIKA